MFLHPTEKENIAVGGKWGGDNIKVSCKPICIFLEQTVKQAQFNLLYLL